MMTLGTSAVCSLLLVTLCVNGMAVPKHVCGDHEELQNPTPDGKLEYVKKNSSEWTNHAIVVENRLLYLEPCEVENFCAVEWYDNQTGEAIEEEPGFITKEGYRLILEKIRLSDGRYYTCKPSQGSKSLEPRTILVQVLGQNTEGLVPLTHPDCKSKSADLGNNVKFYCEYSVGNYDAYDIGTKWYKQNGTGGDFMSIYQWTRTLETDPAVTTVYDDVYSEKGDKREGPGGITLWVHTTALYLSNISEEAFGVYEILFNAGYESITYNVSLTKNPEPVVDPTEGIFEVLLAMILLLVSFTVLAIVVYNSRVDMKLFWKDNFSKECQNDHKENDAYISYDYGESDEDVNFVIKLLKEKLESQGYRLVIRDIDHKLGTSKAEEMVKSFDTCRRCIFIISPSYLESQEGNDYKVVMDKVESCKKQIIPIILKDVDDLLAKDDTNDIKLFKYIIENGRCLKWPQLQQTADTISESGRQDKKGEKKIERNRHLFCKELMLRMPPRPRASPKYNASMTQVDILEHEEKKSSLPTSERENFQNGFPSMYPNLKSESHSNSINTATVPQIDEDANQQPHESRSTTLYPVIT